MAPQWQDLVAQAALWLAGRLFGLVGRPDGALSPWSLLAALAVAAAWVISRRRRRTRPRVLLRALLPRRWWRSASGRADIGWALFNGLLASALLGWAILSSGWIATRLGDAFTAALGPAAPLRVPVALAGLVATLAAYLSYEFGYWVDHWLKHRVPALWAFHRVHHTAETLSPLTNFRVHPVDNVLFYNIVGVCVGTANALAARALGGAVDEWRLFGGNAILILALYGLTHLHHSQLWLPFTGRLGRWVMSPAHHQLHHSADPRHHGSNLGHTLALFDRLAGTLVVPGTHARLRFGTDDAGDDPHGWRGAMVAPFVEAARTLRPAPTRSAIRSGLKPPTQALNSVTPALSRGPAPLQP